MDYKILVEDLEMELTKIDVFSDELCQKHLENGVVKNPIIRKELNKMYDREQKIQKLLNKILVEKPFSKAWKNIVVYPS